MTKKGIFTKNVPHGIEPAPSLSTTESNQLRYVTLVATQLALRLGSVRTSRVDLRKMRCSRWDSNSGRLHQRQLPNQLRYVTLVTAKCLLELESVRTSGRIFLSRKTHFNTHHFDADVAISFEAGLECGCPPHLRACADPPETANLRERYFCGAAIQCQSNKVLPNCPPTRSYLSYLI